MRAEEMTLTGLALSLLAYWELDIAAIPLGLFSISHAAQTSLLTGLILLQLSVAALLLTRGLLGYRALAGHLGSFTNTGKMAPTREA